MIASLSLEIILKKKKAVIHDDKTVEIVEKLDYDFTLADKDAAIDQSEAKFTWGIKNGKLLAENCYL